MAASEAAANSTLTAGAGGDGLFSARVDPAAGKVNDFELAVGPSSLTITDPGDPIDEAVPECSGGGTNTVTCTFPAGISDIIVEAGDLDDSIRVDAPQGMPGSPLQEGRLFLTGGDGSDEITVVAPPGARGTADLNGDDGADPVGDGGDVLTGGGMRDFLSGGGGIDALFGGAGDDGLFPGAGNAERADAGPGDDTLQYRAGDGTDELLDGGEGFDRVAVQGSSAMVTPMPSAFALDLAAATLRQTGGDDGSASVPNFEAFTGNSAVFTVSGTDGHNNVSTSSADDLVDPRGGPDRVRTGSGADRVLARDGFTDRVECGPDSDSVVADQFDELIACESVDLAVVPPAGVERDAPICTVTGVPRRITRGRFLRGLGPTAGCNEPVELEARLTVSVRRRGGRLVTVRAGQLVLAERALPLAAESRRVTLRVPRRLRRVLGRRFAATLTMVALDQFGNRTAIRRVVRVR